MSKNKTISLKDKRIINNCFKYCKKIKPILEDENKKINDLSFGQLTLLFLSYKAFKTFKSILLLIQRNEIEDSLILMRSLFEVLIDVEYISTNPEELGKLFVEYEKVAKYKHMKCISEYKQALLKSSEDLMKAEIGYNSVKNNYNNDKSWSGLNLKAKAERVNKTKNYGSSEDLLQEYDYIYRTLSYFSHPSPRSTFLYYSHYDKESGIDREFWLNFILDKSLWYLIKIIRELDNLLNGKIKQRLGEFEHTFFAYNEGQKTKINFDNP